MNGEELNGNENPDIIETDESGTAQAGAGTPEDATPDYEGLLEKQNATIAALIEQNKSLNDQIAAFVRNTGTRIDNPAPETGIYENQVGPDLPDDYVPLKDLGKAFGSRELNY